MGTRHLATVPNFNMPVPFLMQIDRRREEIVQAGTKIIRRNKQMQQEKITVKVHIPSGVGKLTFLLELPMEMELQEFQYIADHLRGLSKTTDKIERSVSELTPQRGPRKLWTQAQWRSYVQEAKAKDPETRFKIIQKYFSYDNKKSFFAAEHYLQTKFKLKVKP